MSSGRRSTDAQIIAAVSPGAWSNLTLAGGLSAHTPAYTPAVRQWLDVVQLRGAIDGTFATGGTTVTTLAAAYRPASQVSVPIAFDSGTGRLVIATTGVVTAFPPATASVLFLGLAAFSLV